MHGHARHVTMCTMDGTYGAYDFELDDAQEARPKHLRGALGGDVLCVYMEVWQ